MIYVILFLYFQLSHLDSQVGILLKSYNCFCYSVSSYCVGQCGGDNGGGCGGC